MIMVTSKLIKISVIKIIIKNIEELIIFIMLRITA